MKTTKLPRHVKIVQLSEKQFAFEYTKFGWEPSIDDLLDIDEKLTKLANKLRLKVGKLSVYVREGDVAFGYTFTHSSKSRLEKRFHTIIWERE